MTPRQKRRNTYNFLFAVLIALSVVLFSFVHNWFAVFILVCALFGWMAVIRAEWKMPHPKDIGGSAKDST